MPYLLTATPSSPTSWVKMETESVLSGHSEMSSRSRHNNINNINNKIHRQHNNYTSSSNLPLKSNLSVNNFPALPPVPSMPPNLTSLSNYSLNRWNESNHGDISGLKQSCISGTPLIWTTLTTITWGQDWEPLVVWVTIIWWTIIHTTPLCLFPLPNLYKLDIIMLGWVVHKMSSSSSLLSSLCAIIHIIVEYILAGEHLL